ncbi:MAG: hypothetical protein JKY24_02810 [Pseudomonadales bacterium]|nr:hypothetical protein [Pseudomonadales bacterium]
MKVADLSGKQLDYWMYLHASKVVGKTGTQADFDKGYGKGEFQFSTDKTLLFDLTTTYQIRVQFLADEWLASTTSNSCYGENPLEAACRLVVANTFGSEVEGTEEKG